ncbi:DUF3160 domain-containing protein [candidate division WOR-3 bacterium]|nr:DUF3160 domain-containing protein [candidate division WOR-3 bacterium]
MSVKISVAIYAFVVFPAFLWAGFDISDSIPETYQGVDFNYPLNPGQIQFLELAHLNQRAVNYLSQNGFVVVPDDYKDFYMLYENFKYDSIPSYVTADAMLNTYHIVFNKIIRDLEDRFLRERLTELTKDLCKTAREKYMEFKGTGFEDAALDVWAYFEVALYLLEEKPSDFPEEIKDVAQSEIEMIMQAKGIGVSELMTIGEDVYQEDYSQYKPRGHYEGKPERERYFRAMMWYGRIAFNTGKMDGLRRTIIFASIMSDSEHGFVERWQEITSPIEYFVGGTKEITVSDIDPIFEKVYGENPRTEEVLRLTKISEFALEIKEISKCQDLPFRVEEEHLFKFMGQKFVLDTEIYRKLVFEAVGTLDNPRDLPKALDVFAVFGNEQALEILERDGDTEFLNYSKNIEKLRTIAQSMTRQNWERDVYTYWLFVLKTYTRDKGASYPSYMRKLSWLFRNLYAALASYTELKHDTILYANQVMAESGEDIPFEKYLCSVEPDPVFFFSLLNLIGLTEEALEKTGCEMDDSKTLLSNLEDETSLLAGIALKELRGEELEYEEFDILYYFGGWLEWMVFESADDRAGSPDYEWAGVVADIATDPNGRVLEEATGKIFRIYVVIPGKGGRPQIAGGGVYSYYEFPWPIYDRLTDSKWRKMLKENSEPSRPWWSESFIVE